MHDKTKPTITPGRTLFNCSPLQFEVFVEPHNYLPRSGLIRQAMQAFGYVAAPDNAGVWHVHDAEGLRCVEAEPSERRASQVWWTKVGMRLVVERRRKEREWLALRKPGRPSAIDEGLDDGNPSRTAKRQEAYEQLASLWDEMSKLLVQHSPQAEVWMNLALNRALPRPHCVHKVGERRALTHAIRHLFDTEKLNPTIHAALNGQVADDDALTDALEYETRALSCIGDAAGMVPRIALQVALQLSPKTAKDFFGDIHELMAKFDLGATDQVEELCKVATT